MNILDTVASRIRKADVLVLDEETEGLDWLEHKTCGHVLTFGPDPADTFYLPVRHKGGANLDPRQTAKMLQHELKARGRELRVVGHNLKFDLKFLHNDGIQLHGPMEDTLIDSFLVDERPGRFGLADCCKRFGVQDKKGEELYAHLAAKFGGEKTARAQMGRYHELAGDDRLAVDYATGDGTSTWQLWEAVQDGLDNQGLRYIWEIECRVIRVLHRMELRGILIDEERYEQVFKLVSKRLEQAQAALPKDFNDKAPTQLKKYFTDHRITDWPMTAPSKKFPNGQPSFNETFLNQSEAGKKIVATRKLGHLLDSFLIPLRERHIKNGRVHTNFNQTMGEEFGTKTGRLSSNDPNLQQVHKRNKELGSIFRSIFIPDPGKLWWSDDFEQCEPRLLAHFAEVKVLLEGYLSDPPIDAHQAVANAAHIDREPGKRMNQALLTGAGMGRMTELLLEYGADPAQAKQIMRDYFRVMPEIKPFQKRAAALFIARGWIKSWAGRRCRLEDSRFAYVAVNRILQMGNADINKKSLADVDELYESEGDDCQLINDVHDDLCSQVPIGREKVHERAVELMEDYGPGRTIEFSVPMVMDSKSGKSWAEATYGIDTVQKMFKQFGGTY